MGRCYPFILFLAFYGLISSFSCKKEESNSNAVFYGKWKASYGDTVTFARENGRDVLIYDVSGSPGGPTPGFTSDHEFDYQDGKLKIKEGIGMPGDFRTIPSFSWIQKGNSFQIEKREWLYFISSVGTFTFTKIK